MGWGSKFSEKLFGGTKMQSASQLNGAQNQLLNTGTAEVGKQLPMLTNAAGAGVQNGRSTYDSLGTEGVLNAMKQNNLATTNRQMATNAGQYQRSSLGRGSANALAQEGLARNNAQVDQYGNQIKTAAEEAARGRELQWGSMLGSLYGSSLGNSMENAATKKAGLGEYITAANGIKSLFS